MANFDELIEDLVDFNELQTDLLISNLQSGNTNNTWNELIYKELQKLTSLLQETFLADAKQLNEARLARNQQQDNLREQLSSVDASGSVQAQDDILPDNIEGGLGDLLVGGLILSYLSGIDEYIRAFALPRALKEVGTVLKGVTVGFLNFFKNLGNLFKTIVKPITAMFERTKPLVSVPSLIALRLKAMGTWFNEVLAGLAKLLGPIKAVFTSLNRVAGMALRVFGIIDFGLGFLDGFANDAESAFGNVDRTLTQKLIDGLIQGSKRFLKMMFVEPLELLKNAAATALEFVGFEDAAEFLRGFKFEDLFSKVGEALQAILTNAMEYLSNLPGGLEGVMEGLGDLGSLILDLLKDLFSALISVLPEPLRDAARKLVNIEPEANTLQQEAADTYTQKQANIEAIEAQLEDPRIPEVHKVELRRLKASKEQDLLNFRDANSAILGLKPAESTIPSHLDHLMAPAPDLKPEGLAVGEGSKTFMERTWQAFTIQPPVNISSDNNSTTVIRHGDKVTKGASPPRSNYFVGGM